MENEIFKNNSISIHVRSDGIYLSIMKSFDGKLPALGEIIGILLQKGIKDFNRQEIEKALSDCAANGTTLRKISDNVNLKIVEDSIVVETAKDKMSAVVSFKQGMNQTKQLNKRDVYDALSGASVVCGIQDELIDDALSDKQYQTKYTVAIGTVPVAGKNGYLEFYFDVSEKKPIPEASESGTVDFRKLDLFEMVRKDDLLVKGYPPADGADGTNVLGQVVPFQKGKQVVMPRGKNVYASEDGLSLYAATDGHVTYKNRTVEVNAVLQIAGNVDNSTGDIDFIGSVTIKGNVITGFSIKAGGDVEIGGTVEGANIECGGNLTINGGIQGMSKANINVSGNVSCKYIENAGVAAEGNISAGAVMHSLIRCKGFLQVGGQRGGLLVGGRIAVQNKIIAKTIGAPLGTATNIEVGIMQETLQRYEALTQRKALIEAELEKLDKAMKFLSGEKEASTNKGIDRETMYYKVVNSIVKMKEQLVEVTEDLESIMPEMKSRNAFVIAMKDMYPGVKITIGNAVLHVGEFIGSCKVYNNEGVISMDRGAAFATAIKNL